MTPILTQEEWLTCTDAVNLLECIKSDANERSLRLFACACVRAVWPLTGEPEHPAVAVAERFADGQATIDELRAVRNSDWRPRSPHFRHSGATTLRAAANATTSSCAWSAALNAVLGAMEVELLILGQCGTHCDLLRDVLLSPFQEPTHCDPAWFTEMVAAIGRSCYEDGDFTALPILADALEEAGCSDELLLSHLHQSGPHVRGCWALDAVLGVIPSPAEQPSGNLSWLLSRFVRFRRPAREEGG